MKRYLQELVQSALDNAKTAGDLTLETPPEVVIENPKDESMGDFSTTVAMGLARAERKAPKKIAELICKHFPTNNGELASVEIAGPGFINFRMSPSFFQKRLLDMASQGENFGSSDAGKNKKILLEYVSANPTGPLHIGHGRGAAVGNCLSLLLKRAGFDVKTEYYVNDVGNQMNNLGLSALYRYRELQGVEAEFPENLYQGDYIFDIAKEIIEQKGDAFLNQSDEEALPFFRSYAGDSILDGINKDLKNFRVEFDRWFKEGTLYEDGRVEKAVDWLREKGFVYEKDGAVWLKSSAFQDEKDRVIVKQSGERTYFCSDIAYHKDKIDRGFEKIIDIWGADHHGYVPRMQAVLEAQGYDSNVFKVLLVQFVALKRGEEKVSMSTRSGEFVTLSDVLDEVGVDAARYFFLMRSSDTHLDFDLELAKKETPENPVFYIQYAHARICSVFAAAEEKGIKVPDRDSVDLSPIEEAEAYVLIKKILSLPEVIEKSALALEVHRLPHYLQDLVSDFHSYYAKHRVVGDDVALSQARLFLLDCVKTTIANGLSVLGVSAPVRM
ncbi:MAG: arginine--tRNA ligase [Candidatus Nitrohelix vancouverensis]|uniref:Arginine--tRNA ligase n=1 Tax=Candidatus Nitrohelix vancouverensis TaxID=2705534 RepID=A0A7T0C467_9BACT|nr:MAG: arginine--tRNA ligase [Candidatus Nitrohelix vancouverensis]